MRARLADAHGPADGAIPLLTIPRVFGYGFNPVSFWFCHDRASALRTLYADVRNTFGEHRGYMLSAPGHAPIDGDTVLAFRVRRHGEHLSVSIDYRDDGLLIHTAIGLRARPRTGARAFRALLAQPMLAAGVIARIHWQALRLWIKRVPFYGKHPAGEARTGNMNELNDEARP